MVEEHGCVLKSDKGCKSYNFKFKDEFIDHQLTLLILIVVAWTLTYWLRSLRYLPWPCNNNIEVISSFSCFARARVENFHQFRHRFEIKTPFNKLYSPSSTLGLCHKWDTDFVSSPKFVFFQSRSLSRPKQNPGMCCRDCGLMENENPCKIRLRMLPYPIPLEPYMKKDYIFCFQMSGIDL
jgi:hypothetical protein